MVLDLDQLPARLAPACSRFGVKSLDLFGSAARGQFDPAHNDMDFLVEFLSTDWHGAADRWFGLQEALEAELGCKIDLVDLAAVRSPLFLEIVSKNRKPIYAA